MRPEARSAVHVDPRAPRDLVEAEAQLVAANAQIGAAKSVAVTLIEKLKTTAQMIAIPVLLYFDPILGVSPQPIGTVLLWAAAILTLWSMGYYLQRAAQALADHKGT